MRYQPSPVPNNASVPDLQRWLRVEFQRIQECTDDIYAIVDALNAQGVALPQEAREALERINKRNSRQWPTN